MGNGYITPIDQAYLAMLGKWVAKHEEALRTPRPTDIVVDGRPNDFILKDGDTYYLFCLGLPMSSDPNVQNGTDGNYVGTFCLDKQVKSVTWLESGKAVPFHQEGDKISVTTQPFTYGNHWAVRVAKILCKG
jgi:hypothetical protein